MPRDLYVNDVLRERWDEVSRTVTFWNASGVLQGAPRAWTAAEAAEEDARNAANTRATNWATLLQQAADAIATNTTFINLTSPTNAQNAAQIKALSRQNRAIIRLLAAAIEPARANLLDTVDAG